MKVNDNIRPDEALDDFRLQGATEAANELISNGDHRRNLSESDTTLCPTPQVNERDKPKYSPCGWQQQNDNLPDHIKRSVAFLGPFSLNLDTTTLISVTVLLIVVLFTIPRIVFAFFLLLIPPCLLIRHDYHKFLALGPGGTPQTFRTYIRFWRVRPFVLQDLFTPPPEAKDGQACTGFLSDDLPYRTGPPPRIEGVVPERQVEQPAPAVQHARICRALKDLATSHSDELSFDASTVDRGHGMALFVRRPSPDTAWSRGEVCHVHDFDGSLHLSLNLADVGEMLRKGWGRRHPMTGVARGWEWAVKGRLPALPPTFVLIFAPRDEADLETICKIIEAATSYVSGKHFDLKLPPTS